MSNLKVVSVIATVLHYIDIKKTFYCFSVLVGIFPRINMTVLCHCVVLNRLQEISLHPVYIETKARLPNPGERPDPDAAAAAFPDLCGGVTKKKLPRKHLLP